VLGSIGTLPAGKPVVGSPGAPVGAEAPSQRFVNGDKLNPSLHAVQTTGNSGKHCAQLGSAQAAAAGAGVSGKAGNPGVASGIVGIASGAVGKASGVVGTMGFASGVVGMIGVASGVVGMMGVASGVVGKGIVGPVAMVGSWIGGVVVGSESGVVGVVGCVGSLLMVVGNPGFAPNKGFVGFSIGTADPRSRPQPFVMSDQT